MQHYFIIQKVEEQFAKKTEAVCKGCYHFPMDKEQHLELVYSNADPNWKTTCNPDSHKVTDLATLEFSILKYVAMNRTLFHVYILSLLYNVNCMCILYFRLHMKSWILSNTVMKF